jgi:hypothetical protein
MSSEVPERADDIAYLSRGAKVYRMTEAQALMVEPPFAHAPMSNHKPLHMENPFFCTDVYLTRRTDATAVTGIGSSPSGAAIAAS